jgi:hypothetical protein
VQLIVKSVVNEAGMKEQEFKKKGCKSQLRKKEEGRKTKRLRNSKTALIVFFFFLVHVT